MCEAGSILGGSAGAPRPLELPAGSSAKVTCLPEGPPASLTGQGREEPSLRKSPSDS